MKIVLHLLMAVLALGISTPQPACAAATSEPEKTCCCTPGAICKCTPDHPCRASCAASQPVPLDKQLPSRTSSSGTLHGVPLPVALAPVTIRYPVFVSATFSREVNVSPPFGGCPPQALLRLWRI